MKKIFLLILCCVPLFSFFSCNGSNSYVMPYAPGVTVDRQAFADKKELWNSSKPDGYDYTFSFSNRNTNVNCVVDVTVRGGHVSSYVLKKFKGKTELESSESEWNSNKETFDAELKNADGLLIENIYGLIEKDIGDEIAKYNNNSDCYYANFAFNFIDRNPFLSSCGIDSVLMQEHLDGNGAHVEIKIENFKKPEAK